MTIRCERVVFGWVHDPLVMAAPENQVGLHNPSETHLFSAIYMGYFIPFMTGFGFGAHLVDG